MAPSSVLPLSLLAGSFALTRRLAARFAFLDVLTASVRHAPAPSVAEIDELLAARGRGGGVSADARRLTALMDASARGAGPLPWPHVALHAEAAQLAWFSVFLALSLTLSSMLECLRGGDGSAHTLIVIFVVAVAVCSALGRALALVWRAGGDMEVRLSLGVGAVVGLAAAVTFFLLAVSSPPAFFAFPAPGGVGPSLLVGGAASGLLPQLDLGASLRFAFVRPGEGIGWGSIFVAPALAVGSLVGLFAVLLSGPALRLAKYYHDNVAAVNEAAAAAAVAEAGGPIPAGAAGNSGMGALRARLTKAAARLWFYAPALVALLWLRSLGADAVVPKDAVRCSEDAVSRDCRVSLGAGFVPAPLGEGSEAWLGLLSLLPSFLWAYVFPGGAPPAAAWVGESAWLRMRCVAVLALAALQLSLLRPALQRALDVARDKQELILATALAKGPPKGGGKPLVGGGGAPLLSAYGEAEVVRLAVECDRAQTSALSGASLLVLQLLSTPLLLSCLVLLTLRLGGLGGVGICSAVRGTMTGLLGWGAATSPLDAKPDALAIVIEAMARALLGPAAGSELSRLVSGHIDALLAPALWRPVLSFTLCAVCATFFLQLELALLYWRVAGADDDASGGEDDAPKVAKKPRVPPSAVSNAASDEPFATLKKA